MPRFAANLSMLYNEHPFLERFAAAAHDGFKGVEFLFPYAFEPQALRAQLDHHGLQQVLFNAAPGHWESGERGLACLAGRETEFQASIVQALAYAQVLGCPRIHVMAGIAPVGASPDLLHDTYCHNLRWAAGKAAQQGVDVLIEPINTRDMPGYFLHHQAQAHHVVDEVNALNLKVQMDLYHCQIMEGDVTTLIRRYLPTGRVAHFQIAGVPMRHEPDLGELSHVYVLQVLDEVASACDWQGWVGCEYRPARGTTPNATTLGLGWLRDLTHPPA